MAQNDTTDEREVRAGVQRTRRNSEFFNLLFLIQHIYHEVGVTPSSETLNIAEDLTEEQIVQHPVFQSEHPEYASEYIRTHPARSTGGAGTPLIMDGVQSELLTDRRYSETTLRTAVSIGIERYAEDSVRRGVKYEFGAKADGGDSVDCSGFVRNAVSQIEALRSGSNVNVSSIFSTHSDGQVCNVSNATGFMLQGDEVTLSAMKAGMIVGIDSGDKGWDAGRTHGINHIGIVYADSETGKLMFAESKSGSGVTTTELSEWLDRAHSRGYNLYATDVVRLAEENYRNGTQRAPETVTAAAEPVEVTRDSSLTAQRITPQG
ncbi:MAG: hypothetical protein KDI61_02005 [Alphaproteobacteria bacterium]|nr:hypothetical protein [Alphaproteobacteria bacterium]